MIIIIAFSTLINNLLKVKFYRKRKKKVINVLIIFLFFIKIMSKFL